MHDIGITIAIFNDAKQYKNWMREKKSSGIIRANLRLKESSQLSSAADL
jgi:hypothetical protein